MNWKICVFLVLVLALSAGSMAACGSQEDYYETAEDCYEGEVYDPQDQLCYPDPACEDDESCGDVGDDLVGLLLDLADSALSVAFSSGAEDWGDVSEVALITYQVDGNRIVNPSKAATTEENRAYQDDMARHEALWSRFANLIPQEQRSMVYEFVVFTDGPGGTMAAVEPDPGDPDRWSLAVDIADADDQAEFTATLIHEFGHLLTLNERQVPPDTQLALEPDNEALYEEAAASCLTYFPGEGCSEPESYINAFFVQFWDGIYEDWMAVNAEEDEDLYYEQLDAFYQDHQDQFVTDYAATTPEEDIAESWTAFVLQPRPAGDTIAEEKILFFYAYPELVKLRAELAARTYSRLRRQQP